MGPDTIEFARKASRAGIDVRLRVGWMASTCTSWVFPPFPEADAALDHSARFISGILTQA